MIVRGKGKNSRSLPSVRPTARPQESGLRQAADKPVAVAAEAAFSELAVVLGDEPLFERNRGQAPRPGRRGRRRGRRQVRDGRERVDGGPAGELAHGTVGVGGLEELGFAGAIGGEDQRGLIAGKRTGEEVGWMVDRRVIGELVDDHAGVVISGDGVFRWRAVAFGHEPIVGRTSLPPHAGRN